MKRSRETRLQLPQLFPAPDTSHWALRRRNLISQYANVYSDFTVIMFPYFRCVQPSSAVSHSRPLEFRARSLNQSSVKKISISCDKDSSPTSANKLEVLLRRLNKKNDILHVRKIFPRRVRLCLVNWERFCNDCSLVLIWQSLCWDASPTIKFYRRLNQQTWPAIITASWSNSKQFKPWITACARSFRW